MPSPRRCLPWLLSALLLLLALPATSFADPWIGVSGNHLVDRDRQHGAAARGQPLRARVRAASKAGLLRRPDRPASIEAMKSWHINAVRVPLNESCWLGINGVDAGRCGAAYRSGGPRIRRRARARRPLRDPRPALGGAAARAGDRPDPACPTPNTRPTSGAASPPSTAKTAASSSTSSTSPTTSAGSAGRRLPDLRHLLRLLPQRRPAGTARGGALDRRPAAGDAGRPRLVARPARLARPRAQGPGPGRRQPHLRLLASATALPRNPGPRSPARSRSSPASSARATAPTATSTPT